MAKKKNRRKEILIVEDEPQMLKVLDRKISSLGHSTTLAENGEVALKKIQNKEFDLILLDIILPGKSGFDILEAMKAEGIETPVIVISNLGSEDDVEMAIRLGAKDYFIKSNITLRELVSKIDSPE
ncbi:response regulator [Patescibacteria group bacterium]|nr:response regulator [Patescibacteria group bacterium]